MLEREVEVATSDGTMTTFFASAQEVGPLPLVIVYMDIWGIREELRQVARDVASLGYCCALPDLFYREGKVRHDFRDANGRMITLEKLSDADKERVRAPLRKLSDPMVMRDTEALLVFARNNQFASMRGAGTVGYCMGGRHALVAVGTLPEDIRAAACLHGTSLVTDDPQSPHRIAAKAKGEIYCGFAEHDRFAAPAVISALDAELKAAGLTYRLEVHRGIDHGYALPDRDLYDPDATRRDWVAIKEMLRRRLKTSVD
jgi:carboxymethylenebutenolidase